MLVFLVIVFPWGDDDAWGILGSWYGQTRGCTMTEVSTDCEISMSTTGWRRLRAQWYYLAMESDDFERGRVTSVVDILCFFSFCLFLTWELGWKEFENVEKSLEIATQVEIEPSRSAYPTKLTDTRHEGTVGTLISWGIQNTFLQDKSASYRTLLRKLSFQNQLSAIRSKVLAPSRSAPSILYFPVSGSAPNPGKTLSKCNYLSASLTIRPPSRPHSATDWIRVKTERNLFLAWMS